MDEREFNTKEMELRREANNLIIAAYLYDKRPDDKPGQFLNRIKHKASHLEELKPRHFDCRLK